MEVLALVGVFIKYAVWGGYSLAGSYVVRTGVQYYKDYVENVEREKETHRY